MIQYGCLATCSEGQRHRALWAGREGTGALAKASAMEEKLQRAAGGYAKGQIQEVSRDIAGDTVGHRRRSSVAACRCPFLGTARGQDSGAIQIGQVSPSQGTGREHGQASAQSREPEWIQSGEKALVVSRAPMVRRATTPQSAQQNAQRLIAGGQGRGRSRRLKSATDFPCRPSRGAPSLNWLITPELLREIPGKNCKRYTSARADGAGVAARLRPYGLALTQTNGTSSWTAYDLRHDMYAAMKEKSARCRAARGGSRPGHRSAHVLQYLR